MKKLLLTLITAATAASLQAQNINAAGDHARQNIDEPAKPTHTDSLSGWSIEGNIMVGLQNQVYNANSPLAAYSSALNATSSSIKYNTGASFGIEAQAGYFFGKKRNWGIGLGFTYLYQVGNVTLDRLHAEYAAYDNYNNIYRQIVTTNGQVKENLQASSFNIPLLAKYQKRFTKRIGFTADAGLLFNLSTTTRYKTNASFDYEAIYKYVGSEGGITTVYDNSITPDPSDLLITKQQYLGTNASGDLQSYFNSMRNQGYNVGLGVSPRDNRGSVKYNNASLGFLVRPAVSIYMNSYLMLNVGVYYYYQNLQSTPVSNYQITDRVGDYSSVLNTVKKADVHSYGVNVGIRYTFKKKGPKTPEVAPEAPTVQENEPEVASPVTVEEERASEDLDISTPLLFDLNKIIIKESSIPILERAARELKANPNARVTINGYADNTGDKDYNKKLSKKRAAVVKEYLRKKGVDPKVLKTIGHGENHPAATNRTREGRMKNRRVIMKED